MTEEEAAAKLAKRKAKFGLTDQVLPYAHTHYLPRKFSMGASSISGRVLSAPRAWPAHPVVLAALVGIFVSPLLLLI